MLCPAKILGSLFAISVSRAACFCGGALSFFDPAALPLQPFGGSPRFYAGEEHSSLGGL